jgi:integrase
MRQALEVIAGIVSGGRCSAETLPWAGLRYHHAAGIRAALIERYSPATVNKCLSALRGTLEEAEGLSLMPFEEYRRSIKTLRVVKGETLPRGRALNGGEIMALASVCLNDPAPAGRRDAAILALLFACGLRRAEAVALDMADVDTITGAITVRGGKGRKDRTTYAINGALEAFQAWAEARETAPGPFLYPITKGGKIDTRRMSDQAVYLALRKRAAQAKVKEFSPHDLRRTFASEMLDAGADIATVQKMMGHADPSTTARYDRRGEEAKKKAASLLHFPYARGG